VTLILRRTVIVGEASPDDYLVMRNGLRVGRIYGHPCTA
jgi:hypothetical protein